jgi:hypothetical protein
VYGGGGSGWCRSVLGRLGWPIDSLSDDEIIQRLYARWFDQSNERPDPLPAPSFVAAQGIVATLASEGNLDALCWCDGDLACASDPGNVVEASPFGRSQADVRAARTNGPRGEERRRSRRTHRSDVIRFRIPGSAAEGGGWLLDSSGHGLAFITELQSAPRIGTIIQPALMGRQHGVQEFGEAVVVRTELLSNSLGLVCAQLGGEDWGEINE